MFTQEDTHAINTIRVLAADTVFKSNSGHPGKFVEGLSFISQLCTDAHHQRVVNYYETPKKRESLILF